LKGKLGVIEKFVTILTFAVTLTVSSTASADLTGALKECAAIADPNKRIVCFDTLAKEVALTATEKREKKVSGWSVVSKVSPMTDKREVFLQRSSRESIKTDVFGEAHPVFLIHCRDGKTAVGVNWGFIVDGGTIPVTYRLDGEASKTVPINVSDDFRSIASWNNDRSVVFLKTLLKKKKLAIQVTALTQGPITAVFDLEGLEKSIAPLRLACGW
jgi:type VI secretion system VasI family protein